MMTTTQVFLNFLKSRNTGLKQKSADWVSYRQNTLGACEIAALTGVSPFETPQNLLLKKIQPSDMHSNTASTWGNLFEPLARKCFEQKHSARVFAYSISLNLATDHSLYRKVICSPDGYYLDKENNVILLEFKCPFKRKIAMSRVPNYYAPQLQTGLCFSGSMVNKSLFVDSYFRMCSLQQIEPSLNHNNLLNGGNIYQTKGHTALAWGICYLFSKQKLTRNQAELIDIGALKQTHTFEQIMASIAEKDLWCSYGAVRMSFSKEYVDEEFLRYIRMKKALLAPDEGPNPVALFAWKLLNVTELQIVKHEGFLNSIQPKVERFHENSARLRRKIHENLSNQKQLLPGETFEDNIGDDSAMLEAFIIEKAEALTPDL